MTEELKPCPFCGMNTVLGEDDSGLDQYYCGNPMCHVSVITDSRCDNAWKTWNTRPIEDALRAERDALKSEVERIGKEYGDLDAINSQTVKMHSDQLDYSLELRAEVERLRVINNSTYCAFCSAHYERTEDALAQVRDHIKVCEFHPMRKLETEVERLTAENKAFAMLNKNIVDAAAKERAEVARLNGVNTFHREAYEGAKQKAERLRDALEGYADDDNWRRHGANGKYFDWWVGGDDGYEIARAALNGETK